MSLTTMLLSFILLAIARIGGYQLASLVYFNVDDIRRFIFNMGWTPLCLILNVLNHLNSDMDTIWFCIGMPMLIVSLLQFCNMILFVLSGLNVDNEMVNDYLPCVVIEEDEITPLLIARNFIGLMFLCLFVIIFITSFQLCGEAVNMANNSMLSK